MPDEVTFRKVELGSTAPPDQLHSDEWEGWMRPNAWTNRLTMLIYSIFNIFRKWDVYSVQFGVSWPLKIAYYHPFHPSLRWQLEKLVRVSFSPSGLRGAFIKCCTAAINKVYMHIPQLRFTLWDFVWCLFLRALHEHSYFSAELLQHTECVLLFTSAAITVRNLHHCNISLWKMYGMQWTHFRK